MLKTALCMLAAGCLVAATPAGANPLKTLYTFCALVNCADGSSPSSSVVEGSDGTLYGAAQSGGTGSAGVVFAFVPQGAGYAYEVLYSFCQLTNCADGSGPNSALILDTNGDLYGTTRGGGADRGGTAFELKKKKTGWRLLTLYNFCSLTECADGTDAQGGLAYQGAAAGKPYDGKSPLYGTTFEGGSGVGIDTYGDGVVYALARQSGTSERNETLLHVFCSGTNCGDGANPWGVIVDARGILYGVAVHGGANGAGGVYAVSPSLKEEAVLYSFCPASGCPDGSEPLGPLAMDANGNLYGTTASGGAANEGTVFKVVRHGIYSSESVLHSFCTHVNCTDGAVPAGGVLFGTNGTLYGTTDYGGIYSGSNCQNGEGCGTIFRLHDSAYAVLHSFCKGGLPDCADGSGPQASLLLTTAGDLVGTASGGGSHGAGTLFQIAP